MHYTIFNNYFIECGLQSTESTHAADNGSYDISYVSYVYEINNDIFIFTILKAKGAFKILTWLSVLYINCHGWGEELYVLGKFQWNREKT